MSETHYPRLMQKPLQAVLDDTPVVLIHGPRQCGKTTLAQAVGQKLGYTYLSFDDVNVLTAAKTDPVGFVSHLEDKVILDEVQHVPELFTAIKQAVDKRRKPGRFLLTGSANVLLIPKLADSLAGRMEIMNLRPLARCEIVAEGPGLLSLLLDGQFKLSCIGKLGEQLTDMVVTGGYPEPVSRSTERRQKQWHRNYINTLVQRDIRDLARISNLDVIPKLLQLAAAQSAQLLNMSALAAPFQISRPTVSSYFTLLQNIFLLDVLPAWHSNRVSRLIKTPKVHVSDTGLAATLLELTSKQLSTERNMLGHLLESFVYNELRRQATWLDEGLTFYHFRDKDQYEVDIVLS